MRLFIYLSILPLFIAACRSGQNTSKISIYPANVGDIAPDPALDDPHFSVCRENYIPQYYAIDGSFRGEQPAIEAFFKEKFIKNKKNAAESGYITIRFVVNCRGQTGRFRVQEMSTDYRPKKFPPALTAHLLDLTKQLDGWLPGQRNGLALDYYQYLTFTIVHGDLIHILP